MKKQEASSSSFFVKNKKGVEIGVKVVYNGVKW